MATAEYTPSPFPCSIVVVQTSGRHGKTFTFERKNWCVVGANKDCDIIVPFPGVAQLQALIHVKRNGVFLQGIDKQNPVRHPRLKKALLDEEEVLLLPGDDFLLGDRKFLIEYNVEDVCIETNDTIAQALLGGTTSGRKATPRLRRRRKSSIMVGEHDETYVLPTNGSEKLLSETQLARVSRSEAEILPQHEEQSTCKSDESLPQHTSPQKPCSEEGMGSRSLSSDDSAVFSDEGSVSRTINFDSTNEGPQESESCIKERTPAKSAARSNDKSEKKQRRNLVFDRLSKGLPATPRRRENESASVQLETRSRTTLNDTSSSGGNMASGKENVPLYETSKKSDVGKDKDVGSKKDTADAHTIRSPLTKRIGLENQASPPTTRTRTPAKKGLPAPGASRNNPVQTPRSRSVAFATTIELAPGAHYSPFRPRKTVPKTASASLPKKQLKQTSEKMTRSASRVPKSGRSMASLSASQKEARLPSSSSSTSGPVSSKEQLGKALQSVLSTDTNQREIKPTVEYEDDSYPPTPSSSEGENEAARPHTLSEPSPMARVGGALAGFLKRLSGKFDSDQDDSSSETDGDDAHKRLSFSEDLNETAEKAMASSKSPMSPEPVMSSVELQQLSQTVPPERRQGFVNQVLNAANDIREVTNPVSTEYNEQPLGSDEEIAVTQELTSAVQDKDENVCPAKLLASNADISPGEVQQDTFIDDYEDDDTSAHDSIGYEGHSSIESVENEGLECSRSSSLDVSGSGGDTREFEIDMHILRNVCVNGQLGETDDEDAVEIDYEDDPWDDINGGEGNESDEREVAAVVLEDEVEIQNVSEHGHHSENKNESEIEQREANKPKDEDEDSSHETIAENIRPTGLTGHGQGEPRGEDSSMSDTSSATSGEMSPAEVDLSSTSSIDKAHQKHKAEVTGGASSPEKTVEDCNRTVSAVHQDETEAVKRDLSRLKKDELKKRLAQRGLDVEGLKKDLVERLGQDMMFATENSTSGVNLSESESQHHQKSDEEMVDLTVPSEPSTPKRSQEQILNTTSSKSRMSTRRLTRQSLVAEQAAASSPEKQKSVLEAESSVGSKIVPEISLYRRRTLRELRQFLKDRGLDTQLKMRKDELIQHLITHSIGSDGQDLKDSSVSDTEKVSHVKRQNAGAHEKTVPKEPVKSSQKMTVAQIRALLREQGQCQAGTKKTLLERLSAQPERRTRSRRVLDATSCEPCQAGKTCEGAAKK